MANKKQESWDEHHREYVFLNLSKQLNTLLFCAESFELGSITDEWWEATKQGLAKAGWNAKEKCKDDENLRNRISSTIRVAFNLARLLHDKARESDPSVITKKDIIIEMDMKEIAKYNAEFKDLGNGIGWECEGTRLAIANSVQTPTTANLPPYLNLVVDRDKRTVTRKGLTIQPVDLSRKPALWEMFLAMFEAGERGCTKPEMQGKISGEWSSSNVNKSTLKGELKAIAIDIPSGEWRLIDDGE